MLVFDADSGALRQTVDRFQQGLSPHILVMVRPLHCGYFAPPFTVAQVSEELISETGASSLSDALRFVGIVGRHR